MMPSLTKLVVALIFSMMPISLMKGSSGSDPLLTPFGISTSASSLNAYSNWVPAIAPIGVKWLRGFDVFENIEPLPGTWNWKNVDAELDAAAANHMEVSGLFFYGTNWIPTPSAFPTSDLPAWSNYVSTLVNHVAGKVKYWEVWNEPPNFTNNIGTPEDYATIVNVAYAAAHAADPTCNVGLAAQSNNVNWLDQTLVAGAKDHFDYITIHPYEILGTVDSGWEGEYMSIVPTLRKMLAARDPARVNVPICFTEVGEAIGQVNGSTTVTAATQAQDLVKAYSMGIAQGVACINWFEGHDGDSGPMGLLDMNGNPRPAYTAMSQLIQYLGAHPTYLGWVLINNRNYGFIFQGASTSVMVAWAPPAMTDKINFGQSVQLVDPITGTGFKSNVITLTKAPVLIVRVPSALITAAQNNRAQPFPWGGNYTGASSISSTMGTPNTDKGLHQLYAETSSMAVTVYGGVARDCSKSSSQAFTVDPNFLSYTTTPIRISAVVRRNMLNDNAGFNLKYESVSGWKSTGTWTTVPDNTQWHTVTWTISDPQFVGKWAYNFSLDSDSTIYSKYYIQSITVTKL
jgi:hypothetical protein